MNLKLIAGSVLFFITMFVMEPSKKQQQPANMSAPRVMYDSGHDNKVFQVEASGLPQAQFTTHPHNGTYPNGNATQTNDNRVIENSRL